MNIKDVEALAELAKIELSENEKKAILEDMEGILAYVKVIEEVEVLDVEPKYNLKNVWREDKIEPREFSRELITKQFPDAQDGFLKVKKIL
jgi:aspartyl-tRNA(Asn)/glutamyl-tRNA(Gln) amidotransferase subunit C